MKRTLVLSLLLSLFCENGAQLMETLFGNECLQKEVPLGFCAVLFDDDGCEGWSKNIPPGYTELPFYYRNDAESVVVKKGCVFRGFDHVGATERERGSSITLDGRAYNRRHHLWKDLDGDSLVDDISYVYCECVGQELPPFQPGSRHQEERRSIDPNSNIQTGRCPQMPPYACAILFDEADCEIDDWDHGVIIADQEKRSFSIFKNLLNFVYKNEVESFMVKDGCTFEAFDDSDYSDDGIRVTARDGDLLVNLNGHSNDDIDDLNNDIESVKCYCN